MTKTSWKHHYLAEKMNRESLEERLETEKRIKEAYAKQKVEEALKKAKTDYIKAFDLGCKAGEKRINKQKQIEVLEKVREELNNIWYKDNFACFSYTQRLEQHIRELREK